MLTKMKLMIVGAALLGGIGIAAAQSGPTTGPSADKVEMWKAKKAERKAAMLAKYDTNRDGKLDQQERAVMRDEKATERFGKMDANKDGQISLDEFKAFSAQNKGPHARGGFHRHHRKGGAETK
jgi:hypothetical protein